MRFLQRVTGLIPILAVLALLAWQPVSAQDLYDTGTLRTFALSFHDADWLSRLRNNYATETEILADLVVDGQTYPNVGVRIRGNTSYTALPAGSEKFSLKISMDATVAGQELMGHASINLNNGFHDPTFSREVVYNNYVAQFIPNPRANHVLLTLNGANWGVYINVQQPDKRMLRDYFSNEDGLRVGCSNNPNGPGLSYNGPTSAGYTAYQILGDGALADPWAPLITVANSLSNEPLISWPNIDTVFAIDPSIWSVALENFLSDDDSYGNKGCDFITYRDPIDGRMHLLQRDANETFTQTNWTVTRNFSATNKPVLSRVLAVPELRQRYMAHYRRILRDLNWAYFGPRFTAQRNLIDAAVQADPKKLYSYALFQTNFTSTVNMPLPGLAGGNIVGLEQFMTDRANFLASNTELVAVGPTISSVQASANLPAPGDAVWITAAVTAVGSPITQVELYYRPAPTAGYLRLPMLDDGASGDGAAGNGVYGAQLPLAGAPGQRVAYYVAAVANNAFQSRSFLPELAERGPQYVEYFFGSANGMRISEWMYAGVSGEFVEFTNASGHPIDMTGWSMDDSNVLPGAFDLSAFGVVQPGESVIVTDATAASFRTAWGLGAEAKIIGELGVVSGNNFGRNDQIHLFNASDALEDRLYFGDQTFPGSIRTQNISGQATCTAIGFNELAGWHLSAAGDAHGSHVATSGDIGSPGLYQAVGGCVIDEMFGNGFE